MTNHPVIPPHITPSLCHLRLTADHSSFNLTSPCDNDDDDDDDESITLMMLMDAVDNKMMTKAICKKRIRAEMKWIRQEKTRDRSKDMVSASMKTCLAPGVRFLFQSPFLFLSLPCLDAVTQYSRRMLLWLSNNKGPLGHSLRYARGIFETSVVVSLLSIDIWSSPCHYSTHLSKYWFS